MLPASASHVLGEPVRIRGIVQPYAWGGFDFIPALLGVPAGDAPAAELWIGAHPRGAAEVSDGSRVSLRDAIAADPARALGPAAPRFGARLPYLLKVLDVREMLSIQAHPTEPQAADGFAREEAAGVPLDAPHRNYRDRNHKPEALVALTDFWVLQGFQRVAEIRALFEARTPLATLARWLAECAAGHGEGEAIRALYERVMLAPQAEIDGALGPWVRRLEALAASGALDRTSPDYWAARAARVFARDDGSIDRGLVSVYLLNLARLAPGQATFVGPGVLHAYLGGVGVEIMASSDNVLRGGLTPKHVDVPELLRIVRFEPTSPVVLAGEPVSPAERVYPTPAEEFEIARVDLAPGAGLGRRHSRGPDVLLVLEGVLALSWTTGALSLSRGEAAFVPAATPAYEIASDGGAVAFRASLPSRR